MAKSSINGKQSILQYLTFVFYQNKHMRKFSLLVTFVTLSLITTAQTPKTYTSSEILLQLKKLNVLGSVLYIAAHPDDENTRLLGYLANEKLYRTGYLSLTRGDGGQNLIGDEQGIELGLIRTQELLSARRIDGAEQFFSRAYDFGFCKSAEEALATWGHDKILSDVVWVIRKFRPDVIITRFPEDTRAGHGHHAASGILAREAFDAAADPTKFPEQLTMGVTIWRAQRLLWNTFNFGSTNTQSEDQFKTDVGMYNPLLGKSYGEIAALSRSQHKSQGFGVPAQRGTSVEYFSPVKGDMPQRELLDGISTNWKRTTSELQEVIADSIERTVTRIINSFEASAPQLSVPALVKLYDLARLTPDIYWREQKQKEIRNIIEACSGIFLEATTATPYAAQGDSLKLSFTVNNRLGINAGKGSVRFKEASEVLGELKPNTNVTATSTVFIKTDEKITQPYWLENPMSKGSFTVTDQQLIGKAENDPVSAAFTVNIEGHDFTFIKPVRYKFTDPVKGEIYQPLYIVPMVTANISPDVTLFNRSNNGTGHQLVSNYKLLADGAKLNKGLEYYAAFSTLSKGARLTRTTSIKDNANKYPANKLTEEAFSDANGNAFKSIREIDYDHIPSIKYFRQATVKVLTADIKIAGKNIGYITGAGDKVPAALEQMGYHVTLLKETDIANGSLQQFDAIVTGIRAYNTNEWLSNSYEVLMEYVKQGGVLVTQYNTNSSIGPVKSRMAPYPFTISRSRITDEEAKISVLLPAHPVLNYPNKITQKDFEGWIQERSIYNAEGIDSNYQRIFSMKDPGETEQEGSLIIANYGKGKFVYTGLVFFRELPAAVPGAYRLFANIIAKPR